MQAMSEGTVEIPIKLYKCRICGEEKPIEEYYIRKYPNGPRPRSECKVCKLKNDKAHFLKNIDHAHAVQKEYREKNRDDLKVKCETWKKSHYDQWRQKIKEWNERNAEYLRDWHKSYWAKNAEEKHKKQKIYRLKNIEYFAARNKKYYASHKEELLEYNRKYRVVNADKIYVLEKSYRDNHKQHLKEVYSEWRKTLSGKESRRKSNHLRCRELGYAPINDIFHGSDYHHLRLVKEMGEIDNDIGVYIPKSLHESVSHNGNTGRNMDLINQAALSWYISNTQTSDLNELALELCKHYNIAVETTA